MKPSINSHSRFAAKINKTDNLSVEENNLQIIPYKDMRTKRMEQCLPHLNPTFPRYHDSV